MLTQLSALELLSETIWSRTSVSIQSRKRDESRKKSHWFKRRDYIVSDTSVNISMRLLDQILLSSSSSHWWYRSGHLGLRLASSSKRFKEICSSSFCSSVPLLSPFGRSVILAVKALLIACLLPADRSTEDSQTLRTRRWRSVVIFPLRMTVTHALNIRPISGPAVTEVKTRGKKVQRKVEERGCGASWRRPAVENTTYSGLTSV